MFNPARPLTVDPISRVVIWRHAALERVGIVTNLDVDLSKYSIALEIRWSGLRHNITSSVLFFTGAFVHRSVFILKVKLFCLIKLLDCPDELAYHAVADIVSMSTCEAEMYLPFK